MYYILEGKLPILVTDMDHYMACKLEIKRVAFTTVEKSVDISTVFLGLDHNYSDTGPPILFETLVFGGEHDGKMERYATWEEAEAGHKKVVKEIKSHSKEETI